MSAGPVSGMSSSADASIPALQPVEPEIRSALQAIWDLLKNLFTQAPTLKPEEIYTRMDGLRKELCSTMRDSCADMPPQMRDEFAKRATAMIHDVLGHCIGSMVKNHSSLALARRALQMAQGMLGPRLGSALDDSVGPSRRKLREAVFHKAAQRARLIVHLQMQIARTQALQDRAAPQIQSVWVDNPIGPYLPKVERLLLVRAAPPIENLVLRGGGAKGLGNPPALRMLENLGRLSELKQVIGTSAGALTAVCLASGMSAQSFQRLSDETDTQALLGTPADFGQRYPQVQFHWLGNGAGTALETLDRACAGSVTHYLREHWEEVVDTPRWAGLGMAERERMELLRDQVFERSPRTGKMLTFQDLRLLHQLAPTRFKELTLTGYNRDEKKTVHFSAASHPDMPVALAGRISMGIPGFFKAVRLEVQGKTQDFVDGGMGSNMPSEAVLDGLHGQAMEEAAARTLLMTYDEGGDAHAVLHGTPAEREKASGGLISLFTNERLDANKTHFSGVNVLPVFHGTLGTLSFWASAEKVEQAQTLSTLKTLEYIENTLGQARHDLVPSLADAVRLLSDNERQGFLQVHGETDDPLHAALCAAIHAQTLARDAAAGG